MLGTVWSHSGNEDANRADKVDDGSGNEPSEWKDDMRCCIERYKRGTMQSRWAMRPVEVILSPFSYAWNRFVSGSLSIWLSQASSHILTRTNHLPTFYSSYVYTSVAIYLTNPTTHSTHTDHATTIMPLNTRSHNTISRKLEAGFNKLQEHQVKHLRTPLHYFTHCLSIRTIEC